jgi:hypothetical protein
MTGTPRHVVFGTGAIAAVLDALRRRGEKVPMTIPGQPS